MSKTTRRMFTLAEKALLVGEIESRLRTEGGSVRSVAQALGISDSHYHVWVKAGIRPPYVLAEPRRDDGVFLWQAGSCFPDTRRYRFAWPFGPEARARSPQADHLSSWSSDEELVDRQAERRVFIDSRIVGPGDHRRDA